MTDMAALFPPDEWQLLSVHIPVLRTEYEAWTDEQREQLQERAAKAVLDAIEAARK